MKPLLLKLTVEELKLLLSLTSDQLFRREFIDPKMPGYRPNTGDVKLGKTLVERLRLLADERPSKRTSARTGVTVWSAQRRGATTG